ncbi:hypothetical protein HPP92_000003 [Vanilla planifolia]|uniref:S-adenosyl-L-methionine-dependent methyltransferase superfamily protein n=1 Tax=Vanilla planifolia TaxID=51239 RepID=A0A835S0E9_VANPL|nr:hypothetical protein HPP92_000003 [Vanilla planifolia]
MGKSGKKSKAAQRQRRARLPTGSVGEHGDAADSLPSSAYDLPEGQEESRGEAEGEQVEEDGSGNGDAVVVGKAKEMEPLSLSKFDLYQKSVQSPKGDISYLQKFFLMYVGERRPLHLQEDFCGTALLSSEWLRSDTRRTAIGLDLDLEALKWCLENNICKVGYDGYSRISLFHGNVLHPGRANLVKHMVQDPLRVSGLNKQNEHVDAGQLTTRAVHGILTCSTMEDATLPPRDIICAFNYSCCCLQKRPDLVNYFKQALAALSKKGGIFVMDLYGGTSSERQLQLQRKFTNFTYVWEQAEFDIINRRTRISLHFHLGKKRVLRNAFSYDWRLWSLSEIRDCLEEAGFQSVHFWMREMPNTEDASEVEEYNAKSDVKYEELSSFRQQDAWNAYVVGVTNLLSTRVGQKRD